MNFVIFLNLSLIKGPSLVLCLSFSHPVVLWFIYFSPKTAPLEWPAILTSSSKIFAFYVTTLTTVPENYVQKVSLVSGVKYFHRIEHTSCWLNWSNYNRYRFGWFYSFIFWLEESAEVHELMLFACTTTAINDKDLGENRSWIPQFSVSSTGPSTRARSTKIFSTWYRWLWMSSDSISCRLCSLALRLS